MNWSGDRLTDSFSGGVQRAASAQASRSTHSPSLMMRPLSSASRMNISGLIAPCSGWSQRSSASKPMIVAAPELGQRLVVDVELAIVERGAQVGLELAPLAQRLVHRRLVEAGEAAALGLGAVERHVGILDQVGRRRRRRPGRWRRRCWR